VGTVERERKKAEKQAKFNEKKAKQANTAPPTSSKSKEKKAAAEKKAEAEVLPPYVEETPAGQKKGKLCESSLAIVQTLT
jgi:valyl-tRNA synthetase